MKQYNLVIDERLIKEVDKLIKEKGLYSSRSDFIRDAIRARLIELRRTLFEEFIEEETEEHPEMKELVEQFIREREDRKYTGVH
jgi:Arc/MetJ-type ribon-helix-helix transcriptional regulator